MVGLVDQMPSLQGSPDLLARRIHKERRLSFVFEHAGYPAGLMHRSGVHELGEEDDADGYLLAVLPAFLLLHPLHLGIHERPALLHGLQEGQVHITLAHW